MTQAWVQIGLEVSGEQQVDRILELTDEMSRDLSEPLGELMDQLLDSVEAQFDTEGAAAAGIRWGALSDTYAKWKRSRPGGGELPILVLDGGMRAAMLDKESAVHVGPTEAVYEPISEIAGYHQSGADWLGNAWNHPGPYLHHLPQRKMVDLSEEFKHEAVDRTFARWIAKVLREAQTGSGVPLAA